MASALKAGRVFADHGAEMKAVNLLPTDLRLTDRKGSARASHEGSGGYAVLGALALVVLAVVATVLVGNSVKANERELAEVTAQQQAAQARLAALKPYGTFKDLATKRVQTVRDLAAARFDWEQALRDLSRAIPADVTLDSLSGSVTPSTTAGGGSANPLRAAIQSPAIELNGCTSDQLGVARLMARLRAVQGVTRVSLSSSKKQLSTTTTPVAGGATAKPAGCGKGAPPKFALVIFFEGAKPAPAAAAPATGATPAAGTPATTAAPAATPVATPAAGTAAPAATPAPAGQAATQETSTP